MSGQLYWRTQSSAEPEQSVLQAAQSRTAGTVNQVKALFPPLVSSRNCKCINKCSSSRVRNKCLHTNDHVENFGRCYATRRSTQFKDFTSISCIETDWKNLRTAPHFIDNHVNSSSIPIEVLLNCSSGHLHLIAEV